MTEIFQPGGYRYLKAGFQFSSGVAAEPGFEIERARLLRPLPLVDGFAAVEAHLRAIGRPSTAFAACELRSAEPFTEQGFQDFNRVYVKTLERWGIFSNENNPVARTNVCPEHGKPASPVLYAFSYTVPTKSKRGSFIIAGGAEVRGGAAGSSYAERTVRSGETSADAMREKVRFVVALMTERLRGLGFGWQDAVHTQAYTVHDIGALVGEIAALGAAAGGLAWHYTRPPVKGLEFEMDVRGAAREITLQVGSIALPLALHPSCGASPVTSIRVKVARAGAALQAHFRIEGDLDHVRIPSPAAAQRADGLWRHTCCEVFVAQAETYQEFNFSPSGEWAAYAFESYRKPAGNIEITPRVQVKSGSGFLELDAEMPGTGEGRIAVSAVIEDGAGQLSYWAARHPPGRPDFHHRDGFILKLG